MEQDREGLRAQLTDLVERLASSDLKVRERARRSLRELSYRATRSGAESERHLIATFLAAQVRENPRREVKRYCLRLIERIGDREVVPALRQALSESDKEIRERARRALQANPSPEAGAALLGALKQARGLSFQVGLINALGMRGEEKAVDLLCAFLPVSAPAVCEAACFALAKVPTPKAQAALAEFRRKAPPQLKEAATAACLLCAERLLRWGRKDEALRLYRLCARMNEPLHVRRAALRGITQCTCGAKRQRTRTGPTTLGSQGGRQ